MVDRTKQAVEALKRAMGADAYNAEANGGTAGHRTLGKSASLYDEGGRMSAYVGDQDEEDHERDVQR